MIQNGTIYALNLPKDEKFKQFYGSKQLTKKIDYCANSGNNRNCLLLFIDKENGCSV
jgi:hypothetical protein